MTIAKKQWAGLIMAILGTPIGALLPQLLGLIVSALGNATGSKPDMSDTSSSTVIIFGLPLLAGIAIEIWALVLGIHGLRKSPENSTSRGLAVWTVVISGVSALFLLTPFLFFLTQSTQASN